MIRCLGLLMVTLWMAGVSSVANAQTQADAGTAVSNVTEGNADAAATAVPESQAAANPQPADAAVTGEQYVIRLRDIEQRINELKEEIFRSKMALSLLAESVLHNVVGGARAMVQHQNRMGAQFRLVRAIYALDGAPIFNRTDEEGSLANLRDFAVYNGQLASGDHQLTVNLEYRGEGFGIFRYVEGYTFRVRSTQGFSVADGKAIQVNVVAFEKGGPGTPPEERPAVRYVTRTMSLREAAEAEQGSEDSSAAPAQGGGGSHR